nr:hypothetical protein CFP56_11535 [Quercus suber]
MHDSYQICHSEIAIIAPNRVINRIGGRTARYLTDGDGMPRGSANAHLTSENCLSMTSSPIEHRMHLSGRISRSRIEVWAVAGPGGDMQRSHYANEERGSTCRYGRDVMAPALSVIDSRVPAINTRGVRTSQRLLRIPLSTLASTLSAGSRILQAINYCTPGHTGRTLACTLPFGHNLPITTVNSVQSSPPLGIGPACLPGLDVSAISRRNQADSQTTSIVFFASEAE